LLSLELAPGCLEDIASTAMHIASQSDSQLTTKDSPDRVILVTVTLAEIGQKVTF
jgi:hypothetical protein